ncbi:MAG TPA: thiamine pyrophosphate-binding protein, partial [Thermodesulfobacteriota bacterium]|nr:thiamine pyrophosphate-binding protein [Thermodesulfobacteriota bacterium]
EAHSACLPVIAIGCSSKRANAGMGAFQEVDQVAILRPITKWSERVTEPDRIAWAMRRAFSLSTQGRPGPVYVDIPRDTGAKEAAASRYVSVEYPLRTAGDPQKIKEAAGLLLKARNPVLVAGGGAVSSRAFEEVRKIVELLGLPLLTTPCGRGILSEEHRMAFGLVGLYFSEIGEKVYGEADLLMTLGSRNEDFQSGEQRFFPKGAKYIQVDLDPEEMGRNWVPDVALVGDIKLVLQALLRDLQRAGLKKGEPNPRMAKLLHAKEAYETRVKKECLNDASIPLKTKRIVRELYEVFGKDTILVNENGSQDLWSYYWPYYKVGSINSCVAPGEQTCMGGGCSAAIGAKLAMPEKDVVCTTGDGAFQMFMKELATAAQHKAPVTYVVLNNFSLGWIKFAQRSRGNRFISTDYKVQPDFVKIAQANQCHGERVEKPEDIRPALKKALEATRKGVPAVLDFIVDGWDFAPGFKRFYERLAG